MRHAIRFIAAASLLCSLPPDAPAQNRAIVGRPAARPFGRYYSPFPSAIAPSLGYPGYNPYLPYYGGYNYGGNVIIVQAPAAPPPAPEPPRPSGPPAASGFDTAQVVVALPAPGEVWLNGAKQPGVNREFTFTSPQLGRDDEYPFRIRAEWYGDAGRVGAEQTFRGRAGDRQKLAILSGEPVGGK